MYLELDPPLINCYNSGCPLLSANILLPEVETMREEKSEQHNWKNFTNQPNACVSPFTMTYYVIPT